MLLKRNRTGKLKIYRKPKHECLNVLFLFEVVILIFEGTQQVVAKYLYLVPYRNTALSAFIRSVLKVVKDCFK